MFCAFLLVFAALFVGRTVQSDVIVKCLKVPDEKFQIICPKGHVIYNPSVLAGISQHGSCNRAEGDCIGQTKFIQNQVNRCHWRNKCEIKLCRSDTIRCRGHVKKPTELIDYVIIKRAHCIPKGFILDICSKPREIKGFDFKTGVIRSDRRYPRASFPDQKRTCNITIPISESHALITTAFQEDQPNLLPDSVNVYSLGRTENQTNTPLPMAGKVTVYGNETRAINVVASLGSRRADRVGFIIPFAVYRTEMLEAMNSWPENSHDLLKSLDWIFEVKAVIRQCIGNNPGEVTLQCSPDEVIYSTGLSVSGYTRNQPKCLFGRFPCGGLSADILVQQNSCFWQNSCRIEWNGDRKIILSRKRYCIGYVASSLGISDYRCVPKENVYDVCTNVTDHIRTTWGVIRSHPQYPWYFDTHYRDCKRIIRVGKGYSLLLIVQDMNTDPDGRDKFSVTHVTREGRLEVMTSKMAREGAHLTVRGGRLVIRFKPFRDSKSGRGFILIFQKKKLPAHTIRWSGKRHKVQLSADQAKGSMGGMAYRLTNRRLCSGKAAERRRGRSCHARMWTDYFTRID